ncbi:ComEA family DNA-binding protein (plasmid) [Streptomyces zhihengii]|uniref:ComEA family DNA-binding protein n=1 Tax=Streptomyces zhihengii TaxID=1818004 RepID=A0ABS2V567_9ACTN|nr:ComEA family DNA-binding protein [Streptomyces zhihengii]
MDTRAASGAGPRGLGAAARGGSLSSRAALDERNAASLPTAARRRRSAEPAPDEDPGSSRAVLDEDPGPSRTVLDEDPGPSRAVLDVLDEEPGPPPDASGWRWAATRERLPLWFRLRCGLERRTLAALVVVLVVAALFAAQHFWSGRPQSVAAPEVVAHGVAGAAQEGLAEPDPPPGTTEPAATAPAPDARIVVDVSGKVRRPGVLRLPAGARVEDALAAAGGAERGIDLTGLNRARVLTDGEHVVVGVPGAVSAAGGPAPGSPASAGAPAAPISLNSSTAEQLETLPGVGPVLAQHIVDHRTRVGGFRSVDELREVNGIGDRRFADLRNRVRP